MHRVGFPCRFGPFALDPERRRLVRGQEPIWLQPRVMDVLLLLVARAGQIVTKDDLVTLVWHQVAVTDNTIVQAVRALRQALGSQPGGESYIDTLVGKGYRFAATVEADAPALSINPDAVLDPLIAFAHGRSSLESLDRNQIGLAQATYTQQLERGAVADAAHLGLANVYLLRYESTRTATVPDHPSLQLAEQHAREACRLNPESADAWATFALVQERAGKSVEAAAAARKAVTLETGNAHHYLRQASVTWGEERLRAALRAQALSPGLALAHWFVATVFVARGMFERAHEELRAGCVAQDAQRLASTRSRLPAAGLHWLRGLVLAATGEEDPALEAFHRELAFDDPAHVYAREACANSWYAIGAVHLRRSRHDEAASAFREALTRIPSHPLAFIGERAAGSVETLPIQPHTSDQPDSVGHSNDIDRAIALAAGYSLRQRHLEAAQMCGAALMQAEAGSAGWFLPVEPLLHATAHPDAWAPTLALLRARAV